MICPVCGKGLGDQVPDKESVLDELFYDGGMVCIVSEVPWKLISTMHVTEK